VDAAAVVVVAAVAAAVAARAEGSAASADRRFLTAHHIHGYIGRARSSTRPIRVHQFMCTLSSATACRQAMDEKRVFPNKPKNASARTRRLVRRANALPCAGNPLPLNPPRVLSR
jgi:hypothetical protein